MNSMHTSDGEDAGSSIGAVIEGARRSGFHRRLLAILFMAMVVDGYDMTVAGVAAPGFVAQFKLTPGWTGLVFSGSLAGMMVGSAIFGFIGDRFGRKAALVWATSVMGLFTIATAFATSGEELVLFRFATGIGIGGLIPNAVALITEYAPAAHRSRHVMLMLIGGGVGGGLPAFVAVAFPGSDWSFFFEIGGVASLLMVPLMIATLPESVKFLMRDPRHREKVRAILARLGVEALPEQPQSEAPPAPVGLSRLFEGRLRFVTPFLWAVFALDMLVYYFIFGWAPLLLGKNGLDPSSAALVLGMISLGGVCGGLLIGPVLDRLGVRLLAYLFGVSIVVVPLMGLFSKSVLLNLLGFVTGFLLIGGQWALNATAGVLYPTACRSRGVGMALGVGRIGSIIGSLAGGVLMASGASVAAIFAIMALPLAGAFAASCLIQWKLAQADPSASERSAQAHEMS